VGLVALSAFLAAQPSAANEPAAKAIAVFEFELDDRSGGAGIVAKDAIDIEHLQESTAEARRMLAASGRYRIVDIASLAGDVASTGGLQHCKGCEAALAKRAGADLSLVGVITRVNRTEFTMQIVVRDTQSGAVVSNDFTDLRMGANYAWPRGVKWLVTNKILAAQKAQ
jgi:hypothetical protein